MSRKLLESVDTDELLSEFSRDGFSLYLCGGRTQPTAIVGVYEWEDYLDIVNIRGENRVTAARVPRRENLDIFAPEAIVWFYQGNVDLTLKAILTLVHPDHPDAPLTTHAPPSDLHVPRVEQRPLTIRRADPHRAAARAVRLAAFIPEVHPSEPQPRWWARAIDFVVSIVRRRQAPATENTPRPDQPSTTNMPSQLAVNPSRGDSDGHDAASDVPGRVRQR
jgi:hypothetical protein